MVSRVRALRRHGRRRAEEQETGVPAEVQCSSAPDRPTKGARGVQNVRDATEGQSRHDRTGRRERETRTPEHLHEDQPEDRNAPAGPRDAGENRRHRAPGRQQRGEEELVSHGAGRKRDERRVEDHLSVGTAPRLGA